MLLIFNPLSQLNIDAPAFVRRCIRGRFGEQDPIVFHFADLEQVFLDAFGGAGLLAVVVGEQRAFLRDTVNVGRLVAHHALVVGADVPVADVIAPDDEDIGFLCLCQSVRNAECGE